MQTKILMRTIMFFLIALVLSNPTLAAQLDLKLDNLTSDPNFLDITLQIKQRGLTQLVTSVKKLNSGLYCAVGDGNNNTLEPLKPGPLTLQFREDADTTVDAVVTVMSAGSPRRFSLPPLYTSLVATRLLDLKMNDVVKQVILDTSKMAFSADTSKEEDSFVVTCVASDKYGRQAFDITTRKTPMLPFYVDLESGKIFCEGMYLVGLPNRVFGLNGDLRRFPNIIPMRAEDFIQK